MKLLKDLNVSGKRVFVRAGLDVLPKEGIGLPDLEKKIEESYRLHALKPTIDYLISQEPSCIIIVGHIGRPSPNAPTFAKVMAGKPTVTEAIAGRPDGKPSGLNEISPKATVGKPPLYDEKLSTKQLVEPLSKILGVEIAFGEQLTVDNLHLTEGKELKVILLENLRFWPGEEANDPEFAKKLAALADVYINEAFETSHREHASIVGIPALLAHAAGKHLEYEVRELTEVLESRMQPLVAVVGGAKVETKVPVINKLASLAQHVLVGGALPLEIEKEKITFAHNVLVATMEADGKDISIEAAAKFARILMSAKMIVWNGPMGLFEEGKVMGSKIVAKAIVESKAKSIIGGGETVEFAASQFHLSKFSFVSVGGGAMLEFLEGKELPGIKALE